MSTANHTGNNPATILIVRLSAIGDIVMASPVASAIKTRHPNAKLYWLAQAECKDLLIDNPHIDNVIIWPRKEWQLLWKDKKLFSLYKAIKVFKKELARHHFDLAIDLQGLLKSGFLTWLSGAKEKIGLGSREGSQYLMSKVIDRHSGDTTLIGSEYRWLCDAVNFPASPWTMSIGVNQTNIDTARDIISSIGDDYYVFCPFTTRPQKHWHDIGWKSLYKQLKLEQKKIVVLGGPSDIEHAEKIVSDTQMINLTGKTNLQEAYQIILSAKALIGVDTGLTHMGHAANIPTIALFGSTSPYLKTDSGKSKIIYHNLSCSPCKRKPSCGGSFHCMTEISTDEIMQALTLACKSVA